MRPTTHLRQMLASPKMIVAPFVMNAMHARIAEEVGFEAVYMTGSGTSAERGFTDAGFLTQTEMVQNAHYIANAVSVPVIADADTGYGNVINVWRTVREYERAGVAGIHIEDQVFPKKCGFFAGKQVVPPEEMVGKIRAALDARTDPDFVIIARCDAYAVNGWEDTVVRCHTYVDAGADMVFVDGVKSVEDLQAYATDMAQLPRIYNGDLLPTPDVEAMGFRVMICGSTIWLVYKAVRDSFAELKATGKVNPERYASREDVANLLGLPRVYEMERKYGPSDPVLRGGTRC